MSACCNEYDCTRKYPVLVRRSGLTGRWYAITRYVRNREHPHLITTSQKHDVTDDLTAELIAAGWTPPKEDA